MRISAHCFAVTGLGYTTPWCVNAGFIAGGHTTLVADTGANALAAATIHGYATLARPGNSLLVVNLEKHFDHVGGNSFFRERGIDVMGHFGIERTEAEFLAEKAEFHDQILNPTRKAANEEEVFYGNTRLVNPNRQIREETTLELGDCAVQVIFTPGHTPTNISLYVPSDGVVFSGDCLVNGYQPNLGAGSEPEWRQWLESIHRIEALAPATVVPGHGPVAVGGDVAALIASVRRHLERAIG